MTVTSYPTRGKTTNLIQSDCRRNVTLEKILEKKQQNEKRLKKITKKGMKEKKAKEKRMMMMMMMMMMTMMMMMIKLLSIIYYRMPSEIQRTREQYMMHRPQESFQEDDPERKCHRL